MPYAIPDYEVDVDPQFQTVGTQCGHNQYWTPSIGAMGVVGGTTAKDYEFPFQITLYADGSGCGGSIVNENWVITAAHCCDGNVGNFEIQYNITQAQTLFDATSYSKGVVERHIHPQYDDYDLNYDICLLKVDSPFDFSTPSFVQPACLPTNCDVEKCGQGEDVLVAGHGIIYAGGPLSHTLLKTYQVMMPDSVCTEQFGSSWNSTVGSYFCAWIQDQGMADTCSGDSGGPLFCYKNGYLMIQGLTSWGYGCAGIVLFSAINLSVLKPFVSPFSDTPGVYADLCGVGVMEWINGKLITT